MHTTTVIVGAGQAGLAMSKRLTDRSIDHVLLERGEVANSWRRERWDSLRLLTPNWQTRLPGRAYGGDDPDGFMTMPELVEFIDGYASEIEAPVHTATTVTSVAATDGGYRVSTDQGEWTCDTVVIASGACNVSTRPPVAEQLPEGLLQITPHDYRNPDQLPDGGVLVVGAASSGVQLADEIHASGRPVTMAVGEHVRVPRTYRGRDILYWMEASGVLDERYDEVEDLAKARKRASFQLVGTAERTTLDLNALMDAGVQIRGRLMGVNGTTGQFSGSLRNMCALADQKLGRLLDTIDEWMLTSGIDDDVPAPYRPEPTRVADDPPLLSDLASGEFSTVLWATGFRPDYSWLDVDVIDRKGQIRHEGGVVEDAPGMYVIGNPFLRRRKSSFIDGVVDDSDDLAAHLASHLDAVTTVR